MAQSDGWKLGIYFWIAYFPLLPVFMLSWANEHHLTPTTNHWTTVWTPVCRYDPQTDVWTAVAPMSISRDAVGVCLLGDRLYAVGGYDGQVYLNTVEAYDPQTNEWKQVLYADTCTAQQICVSLTSFTACCVFTVLPLFHILSCSCLRGPWTISLVCALTLSTIWPYIDRCVHFQIMSNQLNFPKVDSSHAVEASDRWPVETGCTWAQFRVSLQRLWILLYMWFFWNLKN